jgi:hypothetical protein
MTLKTNNLLTAAICVEAACLFPIVLVRDRKALLAFLVDTRPQPPSPKYALRYPQRERPRPRGHEAARPLGRRCRAAQLKSHFEMAMLGTYQMH